MENNISNSAPPNPIAPTINFNCSRNIPLADRIDDHNAHQVVKTAKQ